MKDKLVAEEREKILKRLKKMLALAADNASPEESAVAAAMAEKIMRKFNLSHADVLMEELEDDMIVAHETETGYSGRVPTWVGAIIISTAQLHDCEARYNFNPDRKTGKIKKVITFLGEKSDVIVAAWVFDYLLKEIRRHTNKYKKDSFADGVSTSSFRKGCAFAVNDTLRRMLREKEQDLSKHSTGKELMVIKRDLVRKKFNISYGKGRAAHQGDQHAAAAGYQAGKGISIRRAVSGSTKTRGRLS